MLKILRLDFFKVFKSRAMQIFLIFSAVLCFIDPVFAFVIHKDNSSVLAAMSNVSILPFPTIIFAVLISAKDYTSGYIKNLYSSTNKLCYILSKTVLIIVYVLSMYLMILLLSTLFNFTFGAKVFYRKQDFSVGHFLLELSFMLGFTIALGELAMFLSTVFKNDVIVLIIMILYLIILSSYLYIGINYLVNDVICKNLLTSFDIQKYSIVGNIGGSSSNYKVYDIVKNYILIFGYSALFILSSWWALSKRSV